MNSSDNKIANSQDTPNIETATKPKKCNVLFWITFILFLIVSYIVYTILRFQRTSEEFPFFQAVDLRESTNFLTSHLFNQITFFLAPAKHGKTRFLNNLTTYLIKSGSLGINIDANFGNFSSPEHLFTSLKNGFISSFSEIKPYLTKEQVHILNELTKNNNNNNVNNQNLKKNKQDKNTNQDRKNSVNIPSNLHSSLVLPYSQIINSIDYVLNTVSNNGNLSLKAIWNFVDTLEEYHAILKPVIIIQNADYLIDSNLSYVASDLLGKLSRQSEYKVNIPIIFELHDSRLLHEPFVHNPLNFFPQMLQKSNARVIRTGKLEDPDIKYLIKNSYFRRYEARKIRKAFGRYPSQFAAVYENLLLGDDLKTAIDREQRRIDQQISLMLQNTPRTGLLKGICRGKTSFDQFDIVGLDNILRNGLLWIDDEFKLHFANKGVKNSICS